MLLANSDSRINLFCIDITKVKGEETKKRFNSLESIEYIKLPSLCAITDFLDKKKIDTILIEYIGLLELKNKKNARNVAETYLEKVGMQNRLMHYPQQLSGGEQQRVAIARAFACEADVLFCDEPTGNLDSSNSELITNLIFDTFMESSSALVIVTHDIALASRCDQKIELVDGKVL